MHNTLRKKKESESESHSVMSDSLQPQNRPEYWTGEPFPSPGDLLAPNYKCVFCFKFLCFISLFCLYFLLLKSTGLELENSNYNGNSCFLSEIIYYCTSTESVAFQVQVPVQ